MSGAEYRRNSDRLTVVVRRAGVSTLRGRMRLIGVIEHAAVVQRILRHLSLPSDVPEPHPARAPPIPPEDPDLCWQDDVAFDPCS